MRVYIYEQVLEQRDNYARQIDALRIELAAAKHDAAANMALAEDLTALNNEMTERLAASDDGDNEGEGR